MAGAVKTQDYEVSVDSYPDGSVVMLVQEPHHDYTTIVDMTPGQAQAIARQLNQAATTARRGENQT